MNIIICYLAISFFIPGDCPSRFREVLEASVIKGLFKSWKPDVNLVNAKSVAKANLSKVNLSIEAFPKEESQSITISIKNAIEIQGKQRIKCDGIKFVWLNYTTTCFTPFSFLVGAARAGWLECVLLKYKNESPIELILILNSINFVFCRLCSRWETSVEILG